MTEQELNINGLKIDTLEIRYETENLNFNVATFMVCWCLMFMYPTITVGVFSDYVNIIAEVLYYIMAIVISLTGFIFALKSFMGIIKLDFIFAGQVIRDIESISKWLTSKTIHNYYSVNDDGSHVNPSPTKSHKNESHYNGGSNGVNF